MKYILLFLILASSAFAHFRIGERAERSDSGIRGPKYAEMMRQIKVVTDLYPELAKNVNIGKTVRGVTIEGVLFKKVQKINPTKLIIITGATHGNEYLNIVDRLVTRFINDENEGFQNYLASGGAVLMIPIMNPDGYDARRRHNMNRKDLNRDYPNSKINLQGLSQIETQGVVGFVNNYLNATGAKLQIVMDYHCCNGSLLYPLGYTKTKMPTNDLNAHQQIGEMMKKYFPSYIYGITGEVLGYFPKGTTKDYWYLEHGALAFTFEGKYRVEDQNIQQHFDWWSELFNHF